MLAAGILLAWVVVLLLTAGIVFSFLVDPDDAPAWVYWANFAFALCGPVLWAYWLSRWRWKRLMRVPPGRNKRLSRLSADERTANRLPHRLVEHHLRSTRFSRRAWCRLLTGIPCQCIIIINGPKLSQEPQIAGTDIGFEPIHLIDDTERAAWYSLRSLETMGRDVQWLHVALLDASPTSEIHCFFRRGLYWLGLLFPVVWFVHDLYQGTFSPRNPVSWLPVVLLAFDGFAIWYRLTCAIEWWLVPGGLIYRKPRPLKRTDRTGFVRANNSPFVLDWTAGVGYVREDEHGRRFPAPGMMALAVIFGWLSQAPPPTEEEAQCFVAGDTRNEKRP